MYAILDSLGESTVLKYTVLYASNSRVTKALTKKKVQPRFAKRYELRQVPKL